jgi:hypothetical protein
MEATTSPERRELAHRQNDGIHVTMFWDKSANRVTIRVLDTRSDDALEFEVAGQAALDAFNHPYPYAATAHIATAREPMAAAAIAANH